MIATSQSAMQEEKLQKGPWNEEEDEQLERYVKLLGEHKWDSIAKASGLKRSGRSCRMRWLNYLCPSIKRGNINSNEEQIIIQLQKQWGNKWSKIARKLPGRTDNEIKNYWRTHLRKKIHAKEEGDLQCEIKNAKQDCTYQKHDASDQKGKIGVSKPVEDNKANADSSLAFCELLSSTYPSSPYEIRLFYWMSELSADQNELKLYSRCSHTGSCLCYLTCKNEDSDSILDSLGSLWDMN